MGKLLVRVHQGEVVAAMIMNSGQTITNDREVVAQAVESGLSVTFLTKDEMMFMAMADLGPKWKKLAEGPVWFKFGYEGDSITAAKEHDNEREDES